MKGAASTFNILDPEVRAHWVKELNTAAVDYLILDCARPIMDAIGLKEATDAGVFLNALSELLQEADIREACLVLHAGHSGERSRGDSRFLDWPDATWTLVRENDDPASTRYIRAFGRDVNVPETALIFDHNSGQLRLGHGSRAQKKSSAAEDLILKWVAGQPHPPKNKDIVVAMRDEENIGASTVRGAIRRMVTDGRLLEQEGPKKSKLYRCPLTAGGQP
jgi:hypothetical protein